MGVEVASGLEPEIDFKKVDGVSRGYWAFVIITGAITVAGVGAWLDCYLHGDYLTALNDSVAWGLIIAGVLLAIGLSAGAALVFTALDLFGKKEFEVFSRFGPLFAALWIGAALAYIFMDIGRVDNMLPNVVMNFNPTSIFAWNAFLYSSYLLILLIELVVRFERMERLIKLFGVLAVAWAVAVHTGTGLIVGMIFSRSLYHSPLHGPIFVASAISSGTGLAILTLHLTFKFTNRKLSIDLVKPLAKIMAITAMVIGYMLICEFFTLMYEPSNWKAGLFAYFDPLWASIYWGMIFVIGIIIPVIIVWNPLERVRNSIGWLSVAGILNTIGILGERLFVTVPGLAFPRELMTGYEIVYPIYLTKPLTYFPSLHEWLMFLGIISAVYFLYALGIKFFAILPEKAG
ncbi:MAG: hypothetical protein DRP01_10005 [Archaeoglobales archaeon]|nr:MAG: hypothetical protein DRP01_10005 [Archaeoglobales archaeon]